MEGNCAAFDVDGQLCSVKLMESSSGLRLTGQGAGLLFALKRVTRESIDVAASGLDFY